MSFPRPRTLSGGAVARILSIAVICLTLIWLSIAVTFDLSLGSKYPQTSLRLWPYGVAGRVALASGLLVPEATTSDLDRARKLALGALARDPTNAAAARVAALAIAAAGDAVGANRLMHYSEQQSRRDLPTQLWLIENEVNRDNIAGALQHYNRALSTSSNAADLLLPILIQASQTVDVAGPLSEIVKTRPPWWQAFLDRAIDEGTNADSVILIAQKLNLDIDSPTDYGLANKLVGKLATDRKYKQALFAYNMTSKYKTTDLVRNGGFGSDQSLLPFDWWYNNESDLNASRQFDEGNNARMVFGSSGGRGGDVARQLLVLSPGRYRIEGIVSNTGADSATLPSVAVVCDGWEVISKNLLPTADTAPRPFSYVFVVPDAKCDGQWLKIVAASGGNTEVSIDALAIHPVT